MKLTKIALPGINIQREWCELILAGKKTVETRDYPLPQSYKKVPIALIQTPGSGRGVTQIPGIIIFSDSFLYKSKKSWSRDRYRHCVPETHRYFRYVSGKHKWGWKIAEVYRFDHPVDPPKRRGMLYTRRCQLRMSAPLEAWLSKWNDL